MWCHVLVSMFVFVDHIYFSLTENCTRKVQMKALDQPLLVISKTERRYHDLGRFIIEVDILLIIHIKQQLINKRTPKTIKYKTGDNRISHFSDPKELNEKPQSTGLFIVLRTKLQTYLIISFK